MSARDPEYVNDELHDTHLIIQKTKELLECSPNDASLHLILSQEQREVKKLVVELEKALLHSRKHTFKIAIQTVKSKYRIDRLNELLDSFQEFLNKSLQTINNTKRETLPLYLNTTYKGSFGVMISTDTEDSLVDTNEKAIGFMFDTFSKMGQLIEDESSNDSLLDHFKNNTKLIDKAKRFYKSVADTNEDIKFYWSEYNRDSVSIYIKNDDAKRYYGYLQKKSEEVEKDIIITGVIKGISLIKNEIEFVFDDGIDISASFIEDMKTSIMNNFDCKVRGLFNKKIKYSAAHSRDEEKYEITKILK